MHAIATTTVTILRGTSLDAYGDPVDNDTVAASGIPASIIERRAAASAFSEQLPRQIRALTGRMASGTDVRDGDRLRDETSGVVYIVDVITQPANPVMTPDLELSLRRIT